MMDDNDIMRELMGGESPFVALENQICAGLINFLAGKYGVSEQDMAKINMLIASFNRHGVPTKVVMEVIVDCEKLFSEVEDDE